MPQLNLNFIDIPVPETCLWEELNHEQKQRAIETLVRLMIKTVPADHRQEQAND